MVRGLQTRCLRVSGADECPLMGDEAARAEEGQRVLAEARVCTGMMDVCEEVCNS